MADQQDNLPEPWPAGWDAHREQQIVFIARNTTPLQRLQWLEDMLTLLRPQMPELLRNRERTRAMMNDDHHIVPQSPSAPRQDGPPR